MEEHIIPAWTIGSGCDSTGDIALGLAVELGVEIHSMLFQA